MGPSYIGGKMLETDKINCADCGEDLSDRFVYYQIDNRNLCGWCRCQYDE